MSLNEDQMPRVYLNNGVANSELAGCTIVHPPHELAPCIAVQECQDLDHLVRWAFSHGYGNRSIIALTTTWDRDDIEKKLGCTISDDFLRRAQEWLDRTSGVLAATTAYHLWEDVLAQMKMEFADYNKTAECRWNGPTDSEGAPCFFVNLYRCEECGHEWQDQWSATCDDDCPACGDGAYQPIKSIELDMAGTYRRMIGATDIVRPVKITEEVWDAWFGPGDLLDLDDPEAANADEHRIWTQLDDGEGDGYLVCPGRHWVNRIGYLIAQRPWDDPQIFVQIPGGDDIGQHHTSNNNSTIVETATIDCVPQMAEMALTHDYEVKFLVGAHVSTESADLGKTATHVHCSAKAFVDPSHPPIELEDVEVQWLEANERGEDGQIIRAIDTAGAMPVD